MFNEIISLVVGSLVPIDPYLFLEDTFFHPVETHVPGLGVFLMDGGLKEAGCGVVVSFYGGGSLLVP